MQEIFNPIEFLGLTLKKIKNGEIPSPSPKDISTINRAKSTSPSILNLSKNAESSIRSPH
jgi:hypothetical protein